MTALGSEPPVRITQDVSDPIGTSVSFFVEMIRASLVRPLALLAGQQRLSTEPCGAFTR